MSATIDRSLDEQFKKDMKGIDFSEFKKEKHVPDCETYNGGKCDCNMMLACLSLACAKAQKHVKGCPCYGLRYPKK